MRVLALMLALSAVPAGREDEGMALSIPPQDPPVARPIAYRGAKVYTLAGPPLENATILVEGGRITDVGKDLAVPAEAAVVDLAGRVVVPGLIDAASPLLVPAAERAGGSAEYDVLDAVDHYERDSREAVEQGVTAVYVGPSSGGGVAGLGAVVRLDAARTVLARRCALKVTMGGGGGEVSTAAGRHDGFQQLRQVFEGAKQYVEAQEKHRKDLAEHEQKKKQAEAEKKPVPPAPAKPKADPRNEILARTLDAKQPLAVRIEVHSADSIGYALKIAEEFKLRAVLECATEGGAVAESIARAKVAVVAGPVFRYGPGTVDFQNHSPGTPASLVRAGVQTAIGTFGDERSGHRGAGASRFLAEAAAFAASRGMTREEALAAITIQPARILGIEKSHGSIEKGKAADFAVLTGEPFEAGTAVERTVIGGEPAFQRAGEGGR